MDVNLLIGGNEAPAQDGRRFERRNPISNTIVTRAAAAGIADAHRAADAAAAAFPAWSATGPGERRTLLLRAADIVAAKAADFAQLMTAEIGATTGWGHFNANLAAGILREAASMTTQIKGEVIPSNKPGCLAMSLRAPVGVCLGIAPWNAPVILGVRAIAMPLACGNSVVLKASEVCPATHALIGAALTEAGFPPGIVNVVHNAPDDAAQIVEALIAHPSVRRVNFTGSTRVGRLIAIAAAKHLKRALLELGGKAPLIVLDDADLDAAVDAAAFSAVMNQGQICMSAERVIVQDAIADDFVERFARKTKTLEAKDPSEPGAPLGALVSAEAAHRTADLIADAQAKGAVLVAGGGARNVIVEPAIVDRVTPAMRIYTEESFGPSVSVIRVKDDEEAIRIANDTEYGLSAAVFSRDINRALSVAQRIQSGICHINGPTVSDEPQIPFGGAKASGYGRFGGAAEIDEFTEVRWLTIETKQHYPF